MYLKYTKNTKFIQRKILNLLYFLSRKLCILCHFYYSSFFYKLLFLQLYIIFINFHCLEIKFEIFFMLSESSVKLAF